MPESERPNILLIMTDQHRGDTLSLERHPVVQTPNMDHIGGRGMHFKRAYTTCPSCIAARRSVLSGQFPSTHGMVGFQDRIEWHPKATMPGELTKAGYQTAIVGRTMHQWPREKRYGFETQELVTGSSGDWPTDYELAMANAHPGGAHGRGAHGIDGNGWVSRPWHLDESLHEVHWTVTRSIHWLKRRDPSCPFFLLMSFNPPHPPSVPPAHYMDRYLALDLPEPYIGDWAQRPANDGLGLHPANARCVLEGERMRNARAGYYGAINYVDDQIARILSMIPPNTVVIFTADHGEMLGDHYLFRKTYAYEGSARVPMMIAGPGIEGGQTYDQPVCLEDIMPTVLDLAGAPIPDCVDGKSLAGVLRGDRKPLREYLHGEHGTCYAYDLAQHYLTDETWKYIWHVSNGHEQLFNLKDDPNELHDLSSSAQHADEIATWRGRMAAQLRDREEGFVEGDKLVAGRAYPAAMSHAGAK
jgi:arylsulfatase A-like enzyme